MSAALGIGPAPAGPPFLGPFAPNPAAPTPAPPPPGVAGPPGSFGPPPGNTVGVMLFSVDPATLGVPFSGANSQAVLSPSTLPLSRP
jgi:hypothetical protein